MSVSRFLCFMMCLSVAASVANAQAVLPEHDRGTSLNSNVFGLGLFGGPATGLGLSFRHHLPSPFSYQVTGGIIKVDEKLSYDIGAEGQFDFVRSTTSRFFVGGGVSYFYSGRSGHNEMNGPGRVGLGVGGELAMTSGINTTIELMFTYFSDGTVLPLPQFGLHYYFY